MEVLYRALYTSKETLLKELPNADPESIRWEYLRTYAPELTRVEPHKLNVYKSSIEKILYRPLLSDLSRLVSKDEIARFINFHTDNEKLRIIDQAGDLVKIVKICLPEEMIIDHLSKSHTSLIKRQLIQAVACGNHGVFSYILSQESQGNFTPKDDARYTIKGFYQGLSVNRRAVSWISELYDRYSTPLMKDNIYLGYVKPMSYLKILSYEIRLYPELVISAKYIFDFIHEKSGLSLEEIFTKFTELTTITQISRINLFCKCEILFATGYYPFSLFVKLGETNPVVKEWTEMTDV